MDYSIRFPNLNINFEHVGKNFSIGGFEVAYYGIVIAFGMLGAILLANLIAKKLGRKSEILFDIALICIPAAVVGARLYYVAFEWDHYKNDLLKIFDLRQGGLAIYGGIIAAVIAAYFVIRYKKDSFWQIADIAAPCMILGQVVGRWGNFFNREAFGQYTDNLFAMQLPVSAVRKNEITQQMWDNVVTIGGVDYIQVHPTFLYESMWNLALMILLLIYFKHRKFDGEIFLLYMLGYGLGRAWIEALRTDQLVISGLGLPVSQLLAAVLVVGSLIWIIIARIKAKKQKEVAVEEATQE